MLKILIVSIFSVYGVNSYAHNPICTNLFKKSKITLQVPFNAGGSFDLTARALADPLKDVTGTKVIIQNNPSLAGLVSLNSVIKSTPKDIHLGFFSGRNMIELANSNKIQWRTSLKPLTTFLSDETVWLTRKKDPADINLVREIIVAGSKNDDLEAKAIAKFLGKPYKLISGYSGSSDYANATLRKEVDFFGPAKTTAERLIKTGDYIPALFISSVPDLNFSNVPHIGGISGFTGKNASDKKKFASISTEIVRISKSDRMIISSTNLPPNTIDCLENSIIKAIDSEIFRNKVAKFNLNVLQESSINATQRLIQIDTSLRLVSEYTND